MERPFRAGFPWAIEPRAALRSALGWNGAAPLGLTTWLRPRSQPRDAHDVGETFAPPRAARVFREGAENGTRGRVRSPGSTRAPACRRMRPRIRRRGAHDVGGTFVPPRAARVFREGAENSTRGRVRSPGSTRAPAGRRMRPRIRRRGAHDVGGTFVPPRAARVFREGAENGTRGRVRSPIEEFEINSHPDGAVIPDREHRRARWLWGSATGFQPASPAGR